MQLEIFYSLKQHFTMTLLMAIIVANLHGIISSRYYRKQEIKIIPCAVTWMNYQNPKRDRFIRVRSFQTNQLILDNRLSPHSILHFIQKKKGLTILNTGTQE